MFQNSNSMVLSRYVLNLDDFILGTELSLTSPTVITLLRSFLSYRYLGKCLIVEGRAKNLAKQGNYPFWIGQKARKVHHLFLMKVLCRLSILG